MHELPKNVVTGAIELLKSRGVPPRIVEGREAWEIRFSGKTYFVDGKTLKRIT